MKSNQFKDELKKLEIKDLIFKLDALDVNILRLKLNSSTSHVKDYSDLKNT